MNGRACVVSTYRLKENLLFPVTREKYYGRTIKEAIHELGHTSIFDTAGIPTVSCTTAGVSMMWTVSPRNSVDTAESSWLMNKIAWRKEAQV